MIPMKRQSRYWVHLAVEPRKAHGDLHLAQPMRRLARRWVQDWAEEQQPAD